jgi:serine/threonine-protein kinase HipA
MKSKSKVIHRHDPKTVETLPIYRQDALAGSLRRTNQGCEFEFAPTFLDDDRFNGLAYRLPKQEKPYQQSGVNLLPFFAGLLPEGLRLKSLVESLKTSQDDLFTLLSAIGQRCIGDVYAVTSAATGSKETTTVPDFNKVDFYDLFASSLKFGAAHYESFAGVQEKISASMISFPLKVAKQNKFYILKLNPEDRGALVQNEYQCLLLADRCGLKTNSARLVQDQNQTPALLVERFDQWLDPQSDKMCMRHQEDACQFLDKFPADKYRLSMRDVADGMQELCTAPLIDTLRLIELYSFSYLIGNGDLHAKNISIHTDHVTGRVEITPAYDLICTYIHGDRNMALQLEGRDAKVKRRDFLKFAKHFNLNAAAVTTMLDRLLKKFVANQALLFDFPMDKKQRTLLEGMIKSRLADLS